MGDGTAERGSNTSQRRAMGRTRSLGNCPVWQPSREFQRFVRKYGDNVGSGKLGAALLGGTALPQAQKPQRKRRETYKNSILNEVL